MIDEIGTAAGEIWDYLNENGETTISKLTRELDQPERTILMGIGWLARESNIGFSTQGRFTYIALKGSESG